MEKSESQQGAVAYQFAHALMTGAYQDAHALLSPACREMYSIEDLRESFETLDYASRSVTGIELMETLDEWPGKGPADIGWAYVSMYGDGFVEGIAVIVQLLDAKPRIRSIEWGRP
jgi:hypothetical protein